MSHNNSTHQSQNMIALIIDNITEYIVNYVNYFAVRNKMHVKSKDKCFNKSQCKCERFI